MAFRPVPFTWPVYVARLRGPGHLVNSGATLRAHSENSQLTTAPKFESSPDPCLDSLQLHKVLALKDLWV